MVKLLLNLIFEFPFGSHFKSFPSSSIYCLLAGTSGSPRSSRGSQAGSSRRSTASSR